MSIENFYWSSCEKNINRFLNDKDLLSIEFILYEEVPVYIDRKLWEIDKTTKQHRFFFTRKNFIEKSRISIEEVEIEISRKAYDLLGFLDKDYLKDYNVMTILQYKNHSVKEKVKLEYIQREWRTNIFDVCQPPTLYLHFGYKRILVDRENGKGFFSIMKDCFYESI